MHTQRISRAFTGGLVAIAAVLLSLVGAFGQEVRVYGLTIPEQVGGLTHGAALDFETRAPGLGYSVQFSRPGWNVDVYMYDFQLKAIPPELESAMMQNHVARTKGDFFGLERSGFYQNIQEVDEFKVGEPGKTQFLCSAYSFLRGEKKDQDAESYLCLTSWNNKFVKVWMTAGKGQMSRSDVTNFVEAWISLLSSHRG